MKPTKDLVMVKPDPIQKETESGILIAETAKQKKAEHGEVIEVGADIAEVKKGDKVYFRAYSADELEVEDEKYLLLLEEDILVREV